MQLVYEMEYIEALSNVLATSGKAAWQQSGERLSHLQCAAVVSLRTHTPP